MLTFNVLGPLEVEDASRQVGLKAPRHRAVLARLLIARGRVVPAQWLIDDLWDEAPEGALGALQTFVAALRKILEPERAPRAPARVLVSAPPGYALRVDATAVDAWRFEAALTRAGELLARGAPERAQQVLEEVVGLWRGPAYAEFADLAWAQGEAARLEQLRLLAVERRAEVQLALGRAGAVVADLQAHVAAFPLREDGRRLLALALYRAGRQADALAELRRARADLQTEVGVDLGPQLQRLQADILAQAASLNLPVPVRAPLVISPAPPAARSPASPSASVPAGAPASHASSTAAASQAPVPSSELFVGRIDELTQLEQVAHRVLSSGTSGLVLISGAAGAGKSTLAEVFTRRLQASGWLSTWGRSPEVPGVPAAWPWTQIERQLRQWCHRERCQSERFQHGHEQELFTSGVADGAGESLSGFERTRALAEHLQRLAANVPVLVVIDDLHWADEGTLACLTALAAEADLGRVLLVGTYRASELSPQLTEALARAARIEPSRLYLGGLNEAHIAHLASSLTSRELSAREVHLLHARSGGNPFFVRELCRLWDDGGAASLDAVPTGVRDVIRHRLSALPTLTRTHLRQAAALGTDVDVVLLSALSGEEDAVLDSLEIALRGGFLEEDDGGRLHFTHALVQEAVYDDIPRARRAQWHAAAASALAASRPDDVDAIASHLLRAGERAPAIQVARFARAAALRAEQRTAPRDAARLWRAAADACTEGSRERLEALMGLVRSLAVSGQLQQARQHRTDALAAAESLGDPVLTAAVLGSFDVPAVWSTNDDEQLSARVVAAAERALAALPPEHEGERARLLVTIAMERRAERSPLGLRSAEEAEQIARRLRDPLLLALALNGRFLHTSSRAGLAAERASIGEQLLQLTAQHPHLVTFEVLGHLIALQAHSALADLHSADTHARAVDLIAERHDLPMPGAFTAWYAAVRLSIEGREDEAASAYRRATGRISGTGMTGLERGILPLALLCLQLSAGVDVRELRPLDADFGPHEAWARPLLLLARGEPAEALAATRAIPDSPHDLLMEARLCLHAVAAVAVGERAAAERVYDLLLPATGQLAGAGSGLLTCGPVDVHLASLATFLNRPDAAANHHRQVLRLADRVGAQHWAAAARQALERT